MPQQYSAENTEVFGEDVVASTDSVRKAQLETELEDIRTVRPKEELPKCLTENPQVKMQTFPEFAREKTIEWLTRKQESGVPFPKALDFKRLENCEKSANKLISIMFGNQFANSVLCSQAQFFSRLFSKKDFCEVHCRM